MESRAASLCARKGRVAKHQQHRHSACRSSRGVASSAREHRAHREASRTWFVNLFPFEVPERGVGKRACSPSFLEKSSSRKLSISLFAAVRVEEEGPGRGLELSEVSRPFAMPGRRRLATCRPLVKPTEPLDLKIHNMWGLASESPLNNRSYHLQKMSSRKPAQSPYTNHWGREGGGLKPDLSGYNSLVTRNSPHRLTRNTSITLAIFSAMFEVPVNTYLLMGLLLYSISTHFAHL